MNIGLEGANKPLACPDEPNVFPEGVREVPTLGLKSSILAFSATSPVVSTASSVVTASTPPAVFPPALAAAAASELMALPTPAVMPPMRAPFPMSPPVSAALVAPPIAPAAPMASVPVKEPAVAPIAEPIIVPRPGTKKPIAIGAITLNIFFKLLYSTKPVFGLTVPCPPMRRKTSASLGLTCANMESPP